MNPDGTGRKLVTSRYGPYAAVAFGSDGKTVAFISERVNPDDTKDMKGEVRTVNL
jgi:hypothetical protein